MLTVHEVARISGVSVRTLHHYDKIGLLKPARVSEAGYRLYDEGSLERLQQILLYRELEFPLKEIKRILDSPGFDWKQALEGQIELLTLRREHLDNLITFARGIKLTGVRSMDFSVFEKGKLDEYSRRARENWKDTAAYREFEEKDKGRTDVQRRQLTAELLDVFVEFGEMKALSPDSPEAQAQVQRLRDFISAHFYNCTPQILAGLGKMYAGGGEFAENIDRAGGPGTAEFAAAAIEIYCK